LEFNLVEVADTKTKDLLGPSGVAERVGAGETVASVAALKVIGPLPTDMATSTRLPIWSSPNLSWALTAPGIWAQESSSLALASRTSSSQANHW
jgi:hypothetical protein